jgi:lysyl-tRNA synthetase class I
MPESQRSDSYPTADDRPNCPKCGKRTMLGRIESAANGLDKRTFDCECGHSETMLVKYE